MIAVFKIFTKNCEYFGNLNILILVLDHNKETSQKD